jgi:hypothetical protein
MVPLQVNGKTYKSIREACANTGISYRVLWEQHQRLGRLPDNDIVVARPLRRYKTSERRREASRRWHAKKKAERTAIQQMIAMPSYGEECALAYANELSRERYRTAQEAALVEAYAAAMADALCDDDA